MGRLPVPQKKAVQLPVFLRKKNGLVPVSHRLFVEVFVSGNKSCLYGYDVPDTSMVPTVGVYPIATANDKSQISAPLMSRFAVIDIPDYTSEEKKF